jgi:serine/threonine protein phosphatase PrpC
MKAAEIRPAGPGTVAMYTAASPCRDSELDNEDAAAVLEVDRDRVVLAVADGLGGHPGGQAASSLALEALGTCVAAAAVDDDIPLRAAVLDGFENANHAVSAMGTGAATTLAAVEIDGTVVRPYHAGDSMILAVGQRGRRKLQTVSHSPVGYLVASGLLDESEAIHHEDRHLVSNIVGTPDMRIEVGPALRLRPRDTVVLASDGLFDNLHLDEIVECVRKGSLEQVARVLAEAARRRMADDAGDHPSKPDDLTFLVFRLGRPRGS